MAELGSHVKSLKRCCAAATATFLGAAVFIVPLATSASATVPKPKISKFVASPKSVTTSDGDVTLSATVANATSCTLSSHQLVAGLPATTSCTPGSVSHAVVLAIDTGVRADKYKFTLAATGSGGTKSKSVTVSVLPGAGQPFPSGFTATYVGSSDDGNQIDANLTLDGSVDPDGSYSWTNLTGTWDYPAEAECPDTQADQTYNGIGGGGDIQADPTSSTGYSASFDFSVWSTPFCDSTRIQFLSHMTTNLPFTPGSTVSVWPSLGGGTYTFDWIY
jgi:hypothetical protein